MLHLYMDGELDSTMQPQLFAELASSDELRNEMSEMIAIRNSVQNDAEAFAVPPESLGTICGRVGITPPVPLPINHLAGGSGIAAWFARYWWAPVAAAIIAVIATSFFMDEYYTEKIDDITKDYAFVSAYDNIDVLKPATKDNSYYRNFQSPRVIEKTKIVYVNKNVYAVNCPPVPQASKTTDNIEQMNDRTNQNYFIENETRPYAFSSNSGFTNNRSELTSLPGIQPKWDISKGIPKSSGTKYSLYLRGLSAKSFPETDMLSTSDPIFTNLSIGTYISRSNNVQFGFEIGQEAYSQVFDNIENGVAYQYMQNPVIFWGALGALVRTNKLQYLGGAQPYAQLLIGGTQLGPLGKLITGIQLNSQEMGIGIILGFEGSTLFYTNQKNWYSSQKIGFTFGTSIFF